MFLFAEMRTEKLPSSPVVTSSGAGSIQVTTEPGKPKDDEGREDKQQAQFNLEEGLERFDTFEEYVVSLK